MKRWMSLACAAALALALSARGQDAPHGSPEPAPPPLAGVIVHGQGEADPRPEHMAEALGQLAAFENFDDGNSVASLVRILLEAAAAPGARVALLSLDAGDPIVAARMPREVRLGEEDRPGVQRWNGEGVAYVLYHGERVAPDRARVAAALAGLEDAFADHRGSVEGGVELMLDLENLRRAWPQSLADGPARRVVAVTGLANARKIHVHVPESGVVRLAYSSRALLPGDVSTRTGPAPAGGTAIGVRWPAIADAALRAYALALEEDARAEFGASFQQWMGTHGNRLRGVLQAVEIGMDWSVGPQGDGLRTRVAVPVRQGIDIPRLAEALRATLAGSGFAVQGDAATLDLPPSLARALGGATLLIEIDREDDDRAAAEPQGADGARLVLTIE